MSFDISATPTLCVASEVSDNQEAFRAAVAEADGSLEVRHVANLLGAVEDRQAVLRAAWERIQLRARELGEQIAASDETCYRALIEGPRSETDKTIKQFIYAKAEFDRIVSANKRLVELDLPAIEIAVYENRATLYFARAERLKIVANRLAGETLAAMDEAVGGQGFIEIDLSRGLSGLLVAEAGRLIQQGAGMRAQAHELTLKHEQRKRVSAAR